MADAVAPRDWRRRKHSTHTTETRVELPQEAIDLMLELTQQIEALKARDAEREREIASLKSDLRVIVQASAHLTEAA